VRWRSASNRRTFSIAMAAWSAKVSRRAICLVREGLHLPAIDHDDAAYEYSGSAPSRSSPLSIGTPRIVRYASTSLAKTSRIWIVRRSSAARPVPLCRPGRIGFCYAQSKCDGVGRSFDRFAKISRPHSLDDPRSNAGGATGVGAATALMSEKDQSHWGAGCRRWPNQPLVRLKCDRDRRVRDAVTWLRRASATPRNPRHVPEPPHARAQTNVAAESDQGAGESNPGW
jgi:hypothetical protein